MDEAVARLRSLGNDMPDLDSLPGSKEANEEFRKLEQCIKAAQERFDMSEFLPRTFRSSAEIGRLRLVGQVG